MVLVADEPLGQQPSADSRRELGCKAVQGINVGESGRVDP
jgi:hypothetical protein